MKKFTNALLMFLLLTAATNIVNAQYITVTMAGTGIAGFSGDGGTGIQANINSPTDVCLDASHNVYFVDKGNNRVRKVSAATGVISTIAGGGASTADGVPATTASLTGLTKMGIDGAGNIYISTANKIRMINAATGIITTVVGTGIAGYSGDGGPATAAELKAPSGVCVDAAGNIYIADVSNYRIRKVTAATGIISTIAGTGLSGSGGDGGPATAATLNGDNTICIDPTGNVFCCDGNTIREIAVTTGIISSIGGYGGITGICADGGGNIYFVEDSCTCQKIVVATGVQTVIANNGSDGYDADGVNSLLVNFNWPAGLCIDAAGNIYVADQNNNRIRTVARLTNTPSFIYGADQFITPCQGYSSPLSAPLAVAELDTPVTETWTVVTPPTMGTLAGFPATASGCGTVKLARPIGTTYTPAASYTAGTDSFQVRVSNGTTSTIVKIYTSINTAPSLPAITGGASGVCTGSNITLTETLPGIWSASNTLSVVTANGATGGLTATVRGVTAGTDTVTFTLASCPVTATKVVIINPLPATAPISGNDTVCVGAAVTMSDPITSGVWSTDYSTNFTVGSVSGIVTGVAYGSDNVSYTVTSAYGCTASVGKTLTVATIANPISGAASVCLGLSIPITESITGGTWSISNGNAMISGSGSPISFTGVIVGVDTVMYTNTNSCGTGTVKKPVTISPLVAPGTVTGPSSVCVGTYILLSTSVSGGTWSAANGDASAYDWSSDAGEVDGNTAGIDTIYYGGACATSKVATIITVNATAGGTIAGSAFVCLGSAITLSDITPGGTWSATNGNASVVSSGATTSVVTGVSAGTDIISYTSTNICGTATVLKSISVDAAVSSSGTISGAGAVCAGATLSLTSTVTGGLWNTTNANASVGSSGVVTGLAAGVDTVLYTAACALNTATAVVTVNPLPNIATISGNDTVCIGSTITLSDAAAGGTWSRVIGLGGTGITVGATTGIVTGNSYGSATVKYTTTNAWCTATTTKAITVFAPAVAIAASTSIVCLSSAITLTETVPGGTWSISNGNATLASTISTSATITGVATGTDTVLYTNTNMCGTATKTEVISVNPTPVPGTISGAPTMCPGANVHYTESSSGGTWSLSNLTVATLAPIMGRVYGANPGTDTLTYTINNGCHTVTASEVITVSGGASAGTITGSTTVCAGTSITLADAAPGGVWSATNGYATVSGGVVNGLLPGVDTIHYSVTSTCGTPTVASTATASQVITVNPLPGAGSITGATSVCIGTPITYTDAVTGGMWSTVNGNASVSGAGLVAGIIAGPDVIQYTVTNSCGTATATESINIDAIPNAGTITGGTGSVCMGMSVALADTTPGGVWSTYLGNASVSGSGVVTGATTGTDLISYTVTNVCGTTVATQSITVDPLPDAGVITATDNAVCEGASITLNESVAGGIWSANNGNASVSGTGVVTGMSPGTVTIQYTVSNSCGTANTSQSIVVNNCNTTTGVSTVTAPIIKTFPNPASSSLNIEWAGLLSKDANVVITDVTGRVVVKTELVNNTTNTGAMQVNLSDLSDGVYLLAISSDTVYYTSKVVVSKR